MLSTNSTSTLMSIHSAFPIEHHGQSGACFSKRTNAVY
jgi:hypothetical protein